MRSHFFVLSAAFLCVLVASFSLFALRENSKDSEIEPSDEDARQEVENIQKTESVVPYGSEIELRFNQVGYFPNMRIVPILLREDSRCPADVQCIQAGTVRIELRIVSGMGTSTNTLALGDTLTTEAEEITFLDALPQPKAGVPIAETSYSFLFRVEKRSPQDVAQPVPISTLNPPLTQNSSCYIGGCSSQLCTDTPDMASTCEYREEYACYRTAVCERQQSGQCGWTHTPTSRACMMQTQGGVY